MFEPSDNLDVTLVFDNIEANEHRILSAITLIQFTILPILMISMVAASFHPMVVSHRTP